MTAFKDTSGEGQIDSGESYSFEVEPENIQIEAAPEDAHYITPDAYDAAFEDTGHTPEEQARIDSAPEPEVMSPSEMIMAISGLVMVVGNLVCARAGVSELKPAEIQGVAEAGYNVMKQYPDFKPASPKMMAWGGLGIAVYAVAAPRLAEKKNTVEGGLYPDTENG